MPETATTVQPYASLTFTHTDRQGNAGQIESLGDRPTVDEAKRDGEDYARMSYPQGDLYWRQFSPRTWGLMLGSLYTHIRITWVGDLPAEEER